MTTPLEPTFPLKEFLGFVIERGEGSAIASMELSERHMNPNATAHGAIPFALMDEGQRRTV